MIRRFTATLLGTAAAMTLVGGVALATPSAGQPVALAALSTPLPAQPPGQPNPPHPNPPPGQPNPGGPNHPVPPPGHPGPPPGHPVPPPPHFLPGHDHPHPGWRYDPHWGWWPGVVTPQQCQDGHGHVNWNDHLCIGGRFDGFRVS